VAKNLQKVIRVLVGLLVQRTSCQLLLWNAGFRQLESSGKAIKYSGTSWWTLLIFRWAPYLIHGDRPRPLSRVSSDDMTSNVVTPMPICFYDIRNMFSIRIFCVRQSEVVANSTRTAAADATKLHIQFCCVVSGVVNWTLDSWVASFPSGLPSLTRTRAGSPVLFLFRF